jgi:hypothetical protein
MILIDNRIIKTKSTKKLPKNRDLIYFSKKNRHAGILGEVLFWQQVHKGKFYGIIFYITFSVIQRRNGIRRILNNYAAK